jgi:hypothetical protein
MVIDRHKPAGYRRRAVAGTALAVLLAAGLSPLGSVGAQEADTGPAEAWHAPEEADALVRAAETGERQEIYARRTEASQVFADPEGGFVREDYAYPQWVRKDNQLVEIDPSLVVNDDGTLSPKAIEVTVVFSGGGDGPMASVTRDGRTVSLNWPGELPAPRIEGNTAVYPEVLPDVDLMLRATTSGMAQLVVVKTPEAAQLPEIENLDLGLALHGLTGDADENGNLFFHNSAGQEVFTAGSPKMWEHDDSPDTQQSADADSNGDTRLARSRAATKRTPDDYSPGPAARVMDVDVAVAEDNLSLKPDRALLSGADTSYPVYIDPDISGSRHSWTIAYKRTDGNCNGCAGTSFFNGNNWHWAGETTTKQARVGYETSTYGTGRAYFRMRTSNLHKEQIVINKSEFLIKNTRSWSATKTRVDVHRTGAMTSSTTWNNQPSVGEFMDSVTESYGTNTGRAASNLKFDVTKGTRDAQSKKWTTITLRLKAYSESNPNYWKHVEATGAKLVTYYHTRPNPATQLDTYPVSTNNQYGCGDKAPYQYIGNTDFYLQARVSGPDGGSVKARFRIWPTGHQNGGDGVIIDRTVTVSSGSIARIKINRSDLRPHLATANGNFSWKARVGHTSTSLWSDWTPTAGAPGCRFVHIPDRPSAPPGVTSTAFPDGSDGWPVDTGSVREQGAFTFDANGQTKVTKYKYWTSWDTTRRTVNAGSTGGTATISLTPTQVGPNQLYVQSLDAAGNHSDTRNYVFYVNGLAVKDKPRDISGNGSADIWGIHSSGQLSRFFGANDGTMTRANEPASMSDWSGAQITHYDDWNDDGYVDLVSLEHDTTLGENRLWMYPNDGTGYLCGSCDGQERLELTTDFPENNHWSGYVRQILAIGDLDGGLDTTGDGAEDVPGFPDLLVNDGTHIWLYYGSASGLLDSYRDPVLIAGPDDPIAYGPSTPDEVTLTAVGDYDSNGRPDLGVRFDSPDIGKLFIYWGGELDGVGMAVRTGRSQISINQGWSIATAPLITSAPAASSIGKIGFWTTAPSSGRLRFYTNITQDTPTTSTATDDFAGYEEVS